MRRDIFAMSVLTLAYWLGNSMLRPLIAPYATSIGTGSAEVGIILAASALPAFALAIPTGLMADQKGYRRLGINGGIALAFGGVVLASFPSSLGLLLAQFPIGIGALAVWLAIQGLMVAPRVENESLERRDRRIANFSLLVLVGQLLGPIVGGFVADLTTYRMAFLGFAILTLVTLGSAWALAPVAPGLEGGGTGGKVTARILVGSFRLAGKLSIRRGMFVTLLVSFSALYLLDVRTAFHPLYFASFGVSATVIGLILSVGNAAALVSRPFLLPLLRRFSVGTVAMICLLPAAVSVAIVVFFKDLVALFVLGSISGLCLGLAQPLTLRLTADFTPYDRRGMGIALRLLANRAAQWVNPVVFSALMVFAGMTNAFLITGGAILVVAIIAGAVLNRIGK